MGATVVFGDVVAGVIGWLDAGLSVPVVKRVPSPRPAAFVAVLRSGGERRDVVVDDAILSVDCWADDDETVADLVSAVRARLFGLAGERFTDGTQVYRVDEVGGPADLPDPLSDSPRMRWTVRVQVRGAAG